MRNIAFQRFAISLLLSGTVSLSISLASQPPGAVLKEAEKYVLSEQWSAAESMLLRFMWDSPSGQEGSHAAELLARVSVFVHKTPLAMEWLELAIQNAAADTHRQKQLSGKLSILQRIYLPNQGYQLNQQFQISGVDMESPRDITITENNQMLVMDRYRLITLTPSAPNHYQAVPPTSPLPDKTRSMETIGNNPVIITDYGYWMNHKIFNFQGAGDLSRIIDAVYTVQDEWLVLDRRNTNMLRFNKDGNLLGIFPIATPGGDESLLKHPLGGCWILAPSSRQIISTGTSYEKTIPYKGPGYNLIDPVAIATDWFAHLYVLNSNKTITIFSPRGAWLRTIDLDLHDDLLKNPSALTVGDDGSIYVADRKKHEIFCYQ